ncbi:hypothetical protein LX64_01342 [Chitinophaga skermanii]|uniref:Uncharacterized protein n=1 Tax=Chitinophaga skermanii TaxID=331697 RepID=A0A327QY64_9BACT|nr:hypothetical protein [Chitinophaga skermanii]RAJ08688.1 hypothetical protein LX64_01342 [Chitinophaga skermanii]
MQTLGKTLNRIMMQQINGGKSTEGNCPHIINDCGECPWMYCLCDEFALKCIG